MQRRLAFTILLLAYIDVGPIFGQVKVLIEKAADKPAAKAAEKPAAQAAPARKDPLERAKQQREVEEIAQAQQYLQMLRPAMWAELEFIRRVGDLTPQQRPKIKAVGEASLLQAARDMVAPRAGAARNRNQTTAAQTVRAALAKAMKETVSPEQFARYNEEADHRQAHIREAAILGTVARLDGLLSLSAAQREKIVDSLRKNWQNDWEQWQMMYRYGQQYFPQVPDPQIVPHLDEDQRTVWRSVQKINVSFWGGEGRPEANDKWWDGEEAGVGQPDRKPAEGGP